MYHEIGFLGRCEALDESDGTTQNFSSNTTPMSSNPLPDTSAEEDDCLPLSPILDLEKSSDFRVVEVESVGEARSALSELDAKPTGCATGSGKERTTESDDADIVYIKGLRRLRRKDQCDKTEPWGNGTGLEELGQHTTHPSPASYTESPKINKA